MKLFGYTLKISPNMAPDIALGVELRRVERFAEPIIFQFRIYRKANGYPENKPLYWRWKPMRRA